MKKILFGALLWMFAVAWVAVLPNVASATGGVNTEADFEWLFAGNQDWKLSTDNKLSWESSAGGTGLVAVRRAINLCLSLLSTIAVVICMYGGFLMVTAAGDEKKYQKGLTVLKYAGMGLLIIALSWIIVSIVFWFVNTAAGGTWDITDGGAN